MRRHHPDALGKRVAGVMGDAELCERVRAVGESVGEPAWPMPLPEDVRKGMDSEVADISQVNNGMDRAGHMAIAVSGPPHVDDADGLVGGMSGHPLRLDQLFGVHVCHGDKCEH